MRKGLLIAGVIFLGLGVIGIFLPIWPTTPFLLLSASCFYRSSPRLHQWLLSHPWFGTYIKNYKELRAIPLKAKILALAALWSAMGYTTIFIVDSRIIDAILLLVGIGVSAHILRLKTLTSEMTADLTMAQAPDDGAGPKCAQQVVPTDALPASRPAGAVNSFVRRMLVKSHDDKL